MYTSAPTFLADLLKARMKDNPFNQDLDLQFKDGTKVTLPKTDYRELDELCGPHKLKYRVCMICGPKKLRELQNT